MLFLDLFISTTVFIVCFVLHSLVHRVLYLSGIKTIKTVIVYLIGFVVLIVLSFTTLSAPLTSLLLYLSLVVLVIIFYFGRLLEGMTPSERLLGLLESNQRISMRELLTITSEDDLIDVRLKSLMKKEYIRLHQQSYQLTQKGKVVFMMVHIYTKFFGIKAGG